MSPSFLLMIIWVIAHSNTKETTIAKIETFIAYNLSFVNITCSDGITGLGQMSHPDVPHDEEIMYDVFNNNVAHIALNYSCERPTDLVNLVWNTNYKSTGIYLSRSMAGLEFAIYDVMGKRANVPVVTLLGGNVNKKVPIYGSSLTRTKNASEIAAEFVQLQQELGLTAFKMRLAKPMGNNTDVYPNRTQDVIVQTRAALEPGTILMGDANGGYTDIEHAKPIAELMAANDFKWFEEPFPWWLYDLHQEFYGMDIIDIALGENEYRMVDGFEYMIKNKVSKYCQPDIGYSGGISHMIDIVSMAEQYGCILDPHSPNPSLGEVYTLHFMGLNYSNIAEFMEFPCDDGIPPKNGYIFEPPLVLKDGALRIPNGAGWGVTLKQDVINAMTDYAVFQ